MCVRVVAAVFNLTAAAAAAVIYWPSLAAAAEANLSLDSRLLLNVFAVNVYDGDQLNLTRISRTEMGAYLCIATNGVPPSVSKRIIVDVECE